MKEYERYMSHNPPPVGATHYNDWTWYKLDEEGVCWYWESRCGHPHWLTSMGLRPNKAKPLPLETMMTFFLDAEERGLLC